MIEQLLDRPRSLTERVPQLNRIFTHDRFTPKERKILNGLRTLLDEDFSNWNSLEGIIVLGASMDYSPMRQRWKFGGIVESDSSRFVGGYSRVIAARSLYEKGYHDPFLVTGGTQIDPRGNSVSRAEELAREISRRIPNEKVITIGSQGNGNTLGNIQDVKTFFEKKDAPIQKGRYGILTNGWHMPRSLLFFLGEDYFARHEIEFKAIVSEDILTRMQPLYSTWVHEISDHSTMNKRIETEVQGIKDFLSNKYEPENS